MADAEEMDYPRLTKALEKLEGRTEQQNARMATTSSSVTSGYRPPTDFSMGLPNYPPAISERREQAFEIPNVRTRVSSLGKRHDENGQWTLPPAKQQEGVMLTLPYDISKYEDVITRWESINSNVINRMSWPDGASKVLFIENLLGETEKRTFQQWREAFPEEYEQLVSMAEDTQNILSQVKHMITLEDPYQGSTAAQERAYADLERLSCEDISNVFQYMNDYKYLAAKTGRMFINGELYEKFFRKLPSLYGKEIEEAFKQKHPGNTIGVFPRITLRNNT